MDHLAGQGRIATGVRGEEGAGDLPGLRTGAGETVHGEQLDRHGVAAGILGHRQVRRQGFVAEDGHLRHQVRHRSHRIDDLDGLLLLGGIAARIRGREGPHEREGARALGHEGVHLCVEVDLGAGVKGRHVVLRELRTTSNDRVHGEVVQDRGDGVDHIHDLEGGAFVSAEVHRVEVAAVALDHGAGVLRLVGEVVIAAGVGCPELDPAGRREIIR